MAWGAGAGRAASRAQLFLLLLAAVLVPTMIALLIERALATDLPRSTVVAGLALVVAAAAVTVAAKIRDQVETNEIFADLRSEVPVAPGLLGACVGGVVAAVAIVSLAANGIPLRSAWPVALAPVIAFAARPTARFRPSEAVRRGSRPRLARSAVRAFLPGLFGRSAFAASAIVIVSGTFAHGMAAAGQAVAAQVTCAAAAFVAVRALIDPADLLQDAWVWDGSSTVQKVARPVALWTLGTVDLQAMLAAVVIGHVWWPALAGIAFVAVFYWCGRVAYAGRQGMFWRDGLVGGAACGLLAAVLPPTLPIAIVGLSGLVAVRAIGRVSPHV